MRDKEIKDLIEAKKNAAGNADQVDLEHVVDTLEAAAARWRDEPVPDWDRVPLATPVAQPGRFRWAAMWIPSAACLVMLALLTLRTEISSGPDGWTIRFGTPSSQEGPQSPGTGEAPTYVTADAHKEALADMETHLRQEFVAYVDQKVDELRHDTRRDFQETLTQFQTDQELYLSNLTMSQNLRHTSDRKRDLDLLDTKWQTQRLRDLDIIEDRIRYLLDQQSANTSTLYSLATAVKRKRPSD
ncbi:hypothetical protein SCOR_09340 [Sulfidibacter corallicola]|uniref:Uncharacterized protein n=1 Tax=Sulfidibacter corallicola TaxID=2818388 RepID=A0A8A4TPY0_SULCO|nr:hypothetical protein [Sulfidibacter corallicola]QTD51038.1 hypothetical protein J3U87_01095 [Sulfidibacter corallicola]